MGNVQTAVKAQGRRHEIVKLCQQGLSNWDIASKLGMAESSVRRHLKQYLESGTHFPSDLSAEQIVERRATEIMLAEGHRQRLLNRAWHLTQRKPVCIEEECALAAAECKISDSLMRISERICSLTGADAPKPQPAPVNVNNTAIIMDNDIIQRIKERRLAKAAIEAPAVTVDVVTEAGGCLPSDSESNAPVI